MSVHPPRLPTLAGRAWTFADRLAAAEILPARARAAPPADAARLLFADLDAGLAARLAPGDVLVAGVALGHGAGGAAAAAALAAAGFVAAVATSFADGFDGALVDAGVPALVVDAPAVFRTGHRLRLDLEGGVVVNQSSGDRQPVRNLSDVVRARLLALLVP